MKQTRSKTKDFSFKQFSIHGGESGMPVSTDGVLLGAWADGEAAQHILDIGTGTGLLALMCAQRFPQAKLDAVELDSRATEAARVNFAKSQWSERVTLIEGDILTFAPPRTYEAIVCNPPYFNSGEQSLNNQRATARHTDSLKHSDLLNKCRELISVSGKASFILPVTEGEEFIALAKETGWCLSRLCRVKPTDNKLVSRLLIEFSLAEQRTALSELTIRTGTEYSKDFNALTKAFYLKM